MAEASRRRRWWPWVLLALVLLLAAAMLRQAFHVGRPVTYADDVEHFEYGSISSDVKGVPYWIWLTMPEVCKGLLPGGYASLGMIQQPGHATPIGFSMRRVGFLDQVGPNCAFCHTGTARTAPGASPAVYPTAPSHQLDLMGYFRFLFACGRSPAFTYANVVAAIERHRRLGPLDRLVYRLGVHQTRKVLAANGAQFDSIVASRPAWGPGRVDTFNPYKVLVFHEDMSRDTSIGTADFMSIWNQAARQGMWLHWDGNNNSLDERNLSAAIGAGATPITLSEDVNIAAVNRVKAWITRLPPPHYPFPIDATKAAAGKPVYEAQCAGCHEPGHPQYGAVIPSRALGTDPERQAAFDDRMAARMNTIAKGKPFAFHHFRTTQGYASHPLDGLWLRAPYLHNGAVPTLRELLSPPAARRAVFYRGNDVYDPAGVGFVSDAPESGGRALFRFDTNARGNANGGHLYGTDLPSTQKDALIEYLKTK